MLRDNPLITLTADNRERVVLAVAAPSHANEAWLTAGTPRGLEK